MSASSFRHVLALLGDDAQAMWEVLDRAVELAEAEHARLTLATPADPGVMVSLLCPLAGVALYTLPPTEAELQAGAGDRLAQAAEFVPVSIPLTTVVLKGDTTLALRRLVESGCHDLLVAHDELLAHNRRLRRAIRKLGIPTLTVPPERVAQSRLSLHKASRTRPATQT